MPCARGNWYILTWTEITAIQKQWISVTFLVCSQDWLHVKLSLGSPKYFTKCEQWHHSCPFNYLVQVEIEQEHRCKVGTWFFWGDKETNHRGVVTLYFEIRANLRTVMLANAWWMNDGWKQCGLGWGLSHSEGKLHVVANILRNTEFVGKGQDFDTIFVISLFRESPIGLISHTWAGFDWM